MTNQAARREQLTLMIGIGGLVLTLLGTIAAYLSIPEFKEVVRERVLHQTDVLYEEPGENAASPFFFQWMDGGIARTGSLASLSNSFSCAGAPSQQDSFTHAATAPVKLGKTRDYAVELDAQLDTVTVRPYVLGVLVRGGYDILIGSHAASPAEPVGIRIQARDAGGARLLEERALVMDGQPHRYRIEVRASEVKVFRDGIFAVGATDDRHAYTEGGPIGLWCSNLAFTLARFRVVKLQ
jgi:hypothetical protein